MPQSLKTTGGNLAPGRFPIMPARQNFALGNFPVLTAAQLARPPRHTPPMGRVASGFSPQRLRPVARNCSTEKLATPACARRVAGLKAWP